MRCDYCKKEVKIIHRIITDKPYNPGFNTFPEILYLCDSCKEERGDMNNAKFDGSESINLDIKTC